MKKTKLLSRDTKKKFEKQEMNVHPLPEQETEP